jgi:hypothetical protein
MQDRTHNEEKLTEDEIARRKLGPRGVPGGEDTAKMTPQQKKNLPKEGEALAGLSRSIQKCAQSRNRYGFANF